VSLLDEEPVLYECEELWLLLQPPPPTAGAVPVAVVVRTRAGLEPGQRHDHHGEYGDKPQPAETTPHEMNPRRNAKRR
jgi:hypothetical protein